MKKVLSLLLSLLLLVGLLAACTTDQEQEDGQQNQESQEGTQGQETQVPDTTEEPTTIRLGGLKGPTSMGMVKLLDDAERGASKSQIAFTPAVTADELTPCCSRASLTFWRFPPTWAPFSTTIPTRRALCRHQHAGRHLHPGKG